MRTIRIKVYQFDELNENARQNAINNERENVATDFIYDDAYKTVQKFNELFGLKEGSRSWLDCNTDNIEDDVLELKGFRLQKYIINNFGNSLFKRKYLKHGNLRNSEPKFYHRMVKYNKINQGPKKGLFSYSYYSNLKFENSCVLTGMCYDDNILNPIYDFLLKRDFSNCTINFYHLLNDCFDEIKNAIEEECDYKNSDEAITEELEQQENEYTINGELFSY